MDHDRLVPLFSAAEIATVVDAMAAEISIDPPDMVVGILTGAVIFTADLIRALYRYKILPELDFLRLSSYGAGVESAGKVLLTASPTRPIEGRDILVLDDILDTGITMVEAVRYYQEHGARRVRSAVLLDKPARRVVVVKPDFVGFACPDLFVAGYGIDKGHAHRGAPFVGVPDTSE